MSLQRDAAAQEGGTRGATDPEISEFLFRACHGLRASVRSMRAHAELLLDRRDTSQQPDLEEGLRFIVDGARKIDSLVEGIASYSIALRTGQGMFQFTPMDAALRTVLVKLDKELRDNHAEVSYDPLPGVLGDSDRLMQVIEHLLCNALRHRSESPPRIHVSAEKQVGAWLFSVRDNGPGVEAAYLEQIFNPFERLKGGESAGPGLGLAICRAIVERHGGRIWAESSAGAGCTFFFVLPAE